ncbi:hypothetical protein SDRG_03120 [Saprolegnia diclina VS20]|uniref:PH domain-containing protein n=1 Tax=Saprolegnia diclina (strain VS20) TaxID=1156394 RepID=T0SA71_SAPDV|nr:hypothetical protein SDRG_03120 [Saprolegnia diclina VS20]EQC39692.1 hypothetical protein SDRG_03120 [Saprolegnia diclina VS20]|eukprot:XP_008606964.1 hypothetical protein SDRG_03120 [Saprolegnia diclina VS20]
MPDDGACISGYLNKMKHEQKVLTPSWNRRWFALDGAELKYFGAKDSMIPSKVIDLLSIESVRPFDTGDHGVYSFVLKTPSRSYFLRADSEGDMKRWVRCLREQQDLWREKSLETPRRASKLKLYKEIPRPPSPGKSKRGDHENESKYDDEPRRPMKGAKKGSVRG